MADWSDYYSGQRVDSLARCVALRHHDAGVGGSIPGLGSFCYTYNSEIFYKNHEDHFFFNFKSSLVLSASLNSYVSLGLRQILTSKVDPRAERVTISGLRRGNNISIVAI